MIKIGAAIIITSAKSATWLFIRNAITQKAILIPVLKPNLSNPSKENIVEITTVPRLPVR